MSFESLAYRYTFNIEGIPSRWLPLIHLYDPDLPLFPIYYFHVVHDTLNPVERPLDTERAFGYVEKINLARNSSMDVTIILNKDLNNAENESYLSPVINEIKERFGVLNPVRHGDLENVFNTPMDRSNAVLSEMWQRVVSNAYGNMLPFGRLWDEVLGLTRFVASWYSQSGRKGELIQTHYFASKFGVKIQSSGEIPQIDFYLLPTIKELMDLSNPLTSFPQYSSLIYIAKQIQQHYCSLIDIDGVNLSKFNNPNSGRFDTQALLGILNGTNIPNRYRPLAIECFNSFGKGPQRTLLFLMLLDDLRSGRLNPRTLNSSQCGSMYDGLSNSYQSPKAIEIYAQQSFGNTAAMPVDTWIDTFLKWPLNVYPIDRMRNKYNYIFSHSNKLGKVERLLWVTGQARKVHSSACNDALWCLKYSSNSKPRGANPFACNICLDAIRNCCPAYDSIKNKTIIFNSAPTEEVTFVVLTSANNNTISNQKFVKCTGKSIYEEISDDFSPADDPDGFALFPDAHHNGEIITVAEFIRTYQR